MPLIEIQTTINAPLERVFDLARSIDLHSISMHKTNEKAIGKKITGLALLNDEITWEATHFGIRQQLTSKISALEFPFYFRDEQVKGAFKSIYHEHFFESQQAFTIMIDKFKFEAPFGILGSIFNQLVLTNYMRRFLTVRNNVIKEYAETDQWKTILTH